MFTSGAVLLSETATLETTNTVSSEADEQHSSDDAKTSASSTAVADQGQVEVAGESDDAAQETTEEVVTPRSFAEIDAVIKSAGSDLKAVATQAISDEEGQRWRDSRTQMANKADTVRLRVNSAAQNLQDARAARATQLADSQTRLHDDETADRLLAPHDANIERLIGIKHTAELHQELVEGIRELRGGDELATRAELADMPIADLVRAVVPELYKVWQADAKANGIDGLKVMTEAAYTKAIKDAREAGANAGKPVVKGQATHAETKPTSGDVTYAQILMMDEAAVKALPQDVFNAAINGG